MMTTVSNTSTKAVAIVASGREVIGQFLIGKIWHTPDLYMSAYESHDHILKYTQNDSFELCRERTAIN